MLKNKPLLITALIFGGIGIILAILTGIMFLADDTNGFSIISGLLGMKSADIKASSLWQFSFIFEAAAFILGYRALVEESE